MDKGNIIVLKHWLETHEHCPYPIYEDLMALTHETGMNEKQIRVWFTNYRNVRPIS